jgi:formate hydrogenlyase subunit 3/multisubunit Na+/H+ antiporter MnhD subunit
VPLAVFPGNQPTSAWSWVVIGAWFGVVPLVLLTIAVYYRVTGKQTEGDEQED